MYLRQTPIDWFKRLTDVRLNFAGPDGTGKTSIPVSGRDAPTRGPATS